MLIGVMSDTHGRVDTMLHAMEILQQRQVDFVIHCGDVGSVRILDFLARLPAAFVWGNCDDDHDYLSHHAQIMGVKCYGDAGRLELSGKTICFLHGDDHRRLQEILNQQDCDFLFYGQSHTPGDTDIGRIRAVNPGALHRAHHKTIALVDSDTRKVEYVEVE